MSILVKKRNKERVMFTVDLALLEHLDKLAKHLDASRSALIVHAIEDLIKELEASGIDLKDFKAK